MASFLSWFGVVFLTPTLPEVGGHFKFQLNLGHPPVEIYRPIDIRRWNRAIYHNVPNRGRAGIDRWVRILDRGFALVMVGWQGDLKPTVTNIVPFLPVARNADGTSIVGPALEEIIFNDDEIASEVRLTYEASTPAERRSQCAETGRVRVRGRPIFLGATGAPMRSVSGVPPDSMTAPSTSSSTSSSTRRKIPS